MGLTPAHVAAQSGTSRTNRTMWALGDHDVGHSRLIPLVTRSRLDPATVCGDDLPAGADERPVCSVAPPVPPR